MAPSRDGGIHSAIPDTPATRAGIAVMSTLDGYLARPPGTYTPARATGSSSRSTVMPFRSNGPSRAGRCWWNASMTDAASERAARSSGTDGVQRRRDLLCRHPKLLDANPIETKRVLPQRPVPPSPDVVHDRADIRDGSFAGEVRAAAEGREGPGRCRGGRGAATSAAAYPRLGRRLSSSIGDRR